MKDIIKFNPGMDSMDPTPESQMLHALHQILHELKKSRETTKEVLSLAEAISLLAIPKGTFYKQLAAGNIPGMKIGRRWTFLRSRLVEWMETKISINSNLVSHE